MNYPGKAGLIPPRTYKTWVIPFPFSKNMSFYIIIFKDFLTKQPRFCCMGKDSGKHVTPWYLLLPNWSMQEYFIQNYIKLFKAFRGQHKVSEKSVLCFRSKNLWKFWKFVYLEKKLKKVCKRGKTISHSIMSYLYREKMVRKDC